MRNFLIIFGTIVSGLAYGWCIVHYPITAQIMAGGMGLSFLFIMMEPAQYTTNEDSILIKKA